MAYYAVPGSAHAVTAFHDQVTRRWLKALRRLSQKGRALTWERMDRIQERWLPPAPCIHSQRHASLPLTQGRSPVR